VNPVSGKIESTLEMIGEMDILAADFNTWEIKGKNIETGSVYLLTVGSKDNSGAVVDILVSQKYKIITLSDSVPVTLKFTKREVNKFLAVRLPQDEDVEMQFSAHTTSSFRPAVYAKYIGNGFSEVDKGG
jgi:hypothetical protein